MLSAAYYDQISHIPLPRIEHFIKVTSYCYHSVNKVEAA